MSPTYAEGVREVKLPEKSLPKKLKKTKSKSTHHHNGVEENKSKGKRTRRSLKFCPKCGSTNVFWASGLPQLWSIWECKRCDYRGALILKDRELAEKLGKKYKNKIVKH